MTKNSTDVVITKNKIPIKNIRIIKKHSKCFDTIGMQISFQTYNSVIAIDLQGHSLHSKFPLQHISFYKVRIGRERGAQKHDAKQEEENEREQIREREKMGIEKKL